MPFSSIKANSRSRFNDVRVHLEFIESLEPKNPLEETPIQVKLLRGLFYVHLYAALEKTANEAVEQALLLIAGQSIENRHYQTSFNVVSLYTRMQAFKSSGYKSFFKKSIDIFSSIDSAEIVQIDNTIFSSSMQNIWYETLNEVFQCFGLQEFKVDSRYRVSVNEVVDKRNAVAHGRESAVSVGERHRSDILRARTSDIQIVADQFIDELCTYISGLEHIKISHRAMYK